MTLIRKSTSDGISRLMKMAITAGIGLLGMSAILTVACPGEAATLKTLYSIQGTGDGRAPRDGLVSFGGKLYGTTPDGGSSGYGTVFTIDPTNGAERVLYSFKGYPDGRDPEASLIVLNGQLYGTTQIEGDGWGTVFEINPTTGAEKVLYAFKGGPDGYFPQASLIAFNGQLYGTTTVGGSSDAGTVFVINPATGAEKVLYSFKGGKDGNGPFASLTVLDGQLYGTTLQGGKFGAGTVFIVNPTTGAERLLHSFASDIDGANPSAALVALNGRLYGTTSLNGVHPGGGTVFMIDPSTGTEKTIYSFTGYSDGGQPAASLVAIDAQLYGTTKFGGKFGNIYDLSGGSVFAIDPSNGTERVLYSFKGGNGGSDPQASLIVLNQQLYGTTLRGGRSGAGTVFTVDPATSVGRILHSFTGPGEGFLGGILNSNGKLFCSISTGGTHSVGEVVVLDTVADTASALYSFKGAPDGSSPLGSLVNLKGQLYGTTIAGGSSDKGAVFAIDPKKGSENVLYSFTGGSDGNNAGTSLIVIGGQLYGTANSGGASDYGTVFTVNPTTGAEKVLYSFQGGSDGSYPAASLTAVNGFLYGTTASGGKHDAGTVFAVDPKIGIEKAIYSFAGGSDGSRPEASLVAINGQLYGTTLYGGRASDGSVFTINPKTGAEKILHSFGGKRDGYQPEASLIAVNGQLYGATTYGGSYGRGTVFTVDPSTGTERVLYSFIGGDDGEGPTALINTGGVFYGITIRGGAANIGTIFKMLP